MAKMIDYDLFGRFAAEAIETPTQEDIAWAAGLYEGEGSVKITNRGQCLVVNISQKDPWCLDRMQALFGGNFKKRSNRDIYEYNLCAERAEKFMALIYFYLSPRRQAQVDACFPED